MFVLKIAKGDYGYDENFTVKTASNVAYPLTGYTVRLKVWLPNSSDPLLIDKACVIDAAPDGTCHYAIVLGDFDVAGTYYAELELTKSGTARESTETFTIEVTDSR